MKAFTTGLLTYFDRVYVVNLPNRHDRRREVDAQLRRLGHTLDRDPVQLFPAVRPDSAGSFPSIGARGCFLSHLGVLQDASRAGYARIAILEDDVDFIDSFPVDFPAVVERLREEPWDIFYGGHRIDAALRTASSADRVRVMTPDVQIATTHFVSFSGATISAVSQYLEQLLERPQGDPAGGPMHVDGAYCWFRASHPVCRTLISDRQLAVQRSSRTDIHALRWFDRMPLVRGAATVLRRARGAR